MRAKRAFYANKRNSVRQMMKWAMKREKLPRPKCRQDKLWWKEVEKLARTNPRRSAIGYVRAFVGKHFFAGCVPGAEHD